MTFASAGWKGDKCDEDVDECKKVRKPCQNNGKCKNTLGSFVCSCDVYHRGRHCEILIDLCKSRRKNPCLNGGVCVNDPEKASFKCNCPKNYIGSTCANALEGMVSHFFDSDAQIMRCFVSNRQEGRAL